MRDAACPLSTRGGGSPRGRPGQVLLRLPYTAAIDVWSLGCLLFAGANGGRSPFESALGQTGGSLALAVLSGKVAWPEEAPEDEADAALRDVVAFLLRKDWRERPTARDAVARIEARLSERAEA